MLFGETTKIRSYDFSILLKKTFFFKCINFLLSYLLFAYMPDLMLRLALFYHKETALFPQVLNSSFYYGILYLS